MNGRKRAFWYAVAIAGLVLATVAFLGLLMLRYL
jgi:small neutral amino acid transporter SnatA (MarC family)